jgi:hypothetical protein
LRQAAFSACCALTHPSEFGRKRPVPRARVRILSHMQFVYQRKMLEVVTVWQQHAWSEPF